MIPTNTSRRNAKSWDPSQLKVRIIVRSFRAWLVVASALSFGFTAQGALIASGNAHTCAWDGRTHSRPLCWGTNQHGELEVPDIYNIVKMESGAWHTCALHLTNPLRPEIACWGSDIFDQTSVPADMGQPIDLSVGRWTSCALYDGSTGLRRVKCWGKGLANNSVRSIEDVNDATALSLRYDWQTNQELACVRRTAGNVSCFGSVSGEWPAASFPRVIGDDGFYCVKGMNSSPPTCWTNQTDIVKPTIHLQGRNLACSLAEGKIVCQGSGIARSISVPALERPYALAVGDQHACAIDGTSVICWGGNRHGEGFPPSDRLLFGPMLTSPASAERFFELLSELLYQFDAAFALGLRKIAENKPDDGSRAALLMTVRPWLAGLDYKIWQDHFLPMSLNSIDHMKTLYDAEGVSGHGDHARLNLRIAAEAISTAQSQMSGAAGERFAQAVRDLSATASSGVVTPEMISSLETIIGDLESNRYLESRADMIRMIIERLQ